MPPCRLILCEKTGRWAAALRISLDAAGPQLVETRSLAACEEALAQSPASLVAVEVTVANLEAVVEFLRQSSQRFGQSVVVALLTVDTAAAASLLREAGAIEALRSVLEAPRLARLAGRQFALAPAEQLSLREFTAQRMPWAAHRTPPVGINTVT
jgi:hypothetical protein